MKTYAVQYYYNRKMVIEIIRSHSQISAELQIIREKGMVYFIESWEII
ncbi:hypothetical protein [Sebaldella termitidis]